MWCLKSGFLLISHDISLQEQTRIFFARAIREIRGGIAPRNENALEVGPTILNVCPIDLLWGGVVEHDCVLWWSPVEEIYPPQF